ncbi:MAG: glycosyltransferase family 4 protein, partial [Legionella sp.]
YERDGLVSIRRIVLPNTSNGIIGQARSFLRYAREVKKITKDTQYSLIFATSSRLMTAALGAYVARKKKTLLYLDIRDIFVDTINDVFPKKITFFAEPLFSLLEKWTFKRAARINLVSKGFKEYFTRRYPSVKLSWFTNGIDSEFIPTTQPEHKSLDPLKKLTVLYAGNIGEGQGLHLILPILAKKLENRVHFRVIGDGGRIEQLKQATQHSSNITLLPPVNRMELIQEYQKADILFLHLNDYSAFRKVLPSKIFEYAATGKPIWAGIAGYSAQFVQEEVDNVAIFAPCNAAQAEEVFHTLKFAPENREKFIEAYSRTNIMNVMAKEILEMS